MHSNNVTYLHSRAKLIRTLCCTSRIRCTPSKVSDMASSSRIYTTYPLDPPLPFEKEVGVSETDFTLFSSFFLVELYGCIWKGARGFYTTVQGTS